MDELKIVLDRILKKSPQYGEKQKKFEIFEKWELAVGEKIARHTKPVTLTEEGILIVATDNSSWSQHLKYMERQILTKLGEVLGDKNRIKGLKFCVKGGSEVETSGKYPKPGRPGPKRQP